MADKGHVYYCSWKQEADGTFTGWLTKRPSLRAHAASKRELTSALGDVAGEYHDDHEAALDFDPPLSTGELDSALFRDDIVSISWNTGVRLLPSVDGVFERGHCARCGRGLGKRTAQSLAVDYIDEESDGAFSAGRLDRQPAQLSAHLYIVSELFLERLTNEEQETFEARPVRSDPRMSKRFFEMVPKRFVPVVTIKDYVVTGWRCDICGFRLIGNSFGSFGWGIKVICRNDLVPGAFFVGDRTDYRFCLSKSRWQQLRDTQGMFNAMADPVAVVDPIKCEREPALPTLDELAEFRRIHGFKVPYKRPET